MAGAVGRGDGAVLCQDRRSEEEEAGQRERDRGGAEEMKQKERRQGVWRAER
ncbi:MAG: hypothetical protein SOX46_10625 [Clostridiaceae bacterium]|nr:hypothetical protein [Clostridiaceae bacterium]